MQKKNKFQLILGSQSPRRKELLQWLFLPFKIVTSDLDEISTKTDVRSVVKDLASQKARHVFSLSQKMYARPFVIGADTIVVVDTEVLNKPKDRDEAKVMLKKLQGRSHRVLTGVCFVWNEKEHTFYDETIVSFDKISDELMELYLDTGESMDKAGAYGIQGAALSFIGKLQGSYSTVVGLPLSMVLKELESVLTSDGEQNWRDQFEK